MSLEIERLPEFEKDMKRLSKRFETLEEDLATFIRAALQGFLVHNQQMDWMVRIPHLGFDEPAVYKARRFACRSLKGKGSNSGMRVIYACYAEGQRVVLVEIYFKGDKENEDRKRIMRHFGAG